MSIAKSLSKKIVLTHSMKFFSREFALNLHKSTIQPCMEYCCHVWAGATIHYLKLPGYKNRYAGLLVLPLPSLLNPWLIVEM